MKKLILMSFAGAVLAGCSGAITRVQTWEGPAASEAQVATLKAPGSVNVIEVNGRRVGNFLMEDLALDYELLPGRNTVIATHQTIWAKSGVVDNGEAKVDTIASEPQQFVIMAEAGDVYRFDLPELSTRAEAKAFAKNFTGRVVDQQGKVVAEARSYQSKPAVLPVLPRSSSDEQVGDNTGTGDEGSEPPGNTLQELKQIWGQATAEERRAFLRWAFE
ncbi:DUF2057 family protein [Marinobacter caseinilyticus]|uniref:DUF2057 family protein n=1 Tax=Marinobacter caseinilyticus TaxID=2692195 RepID=UPI001F3B1C56|nr:DUF2057 family protein [Marinobacter caseinilyticus]